MNLADWEGRSPPTEQALQPAHWRKMLENKERHQPKRASTAQASGFHLKQVVNETISIHKWVSFAVDGSARHSRPHIKLDEVCHAKQGMEPQLSELLPVQDSRWQTRKDNKSMFLLMRIIYHHYINLINVMGPFQEEEITGH